MSGDPDYTGIVSIHDVMPRTLAEVAGLLRWLETMQVAPVTLLVVPGADWSRTDLDTLRSWEAAGCELAGHGWCHETTPRTLRHRLHAAVISRNVAEHLALSPEGIADLVRRCHAWFGRHGFRDPELYVPPAWAMGSIRACALRGLPFARYEYLHGVLEASRDEFERIPMVGFEADKPWRTAAVKGWNACSLLAARLRGGAVRVGIHPHDRSLRLAGDLEAILGRCGRFRGYRKA